MLVLASHDIWKSQGSVSEKPLFSHWENGIMTLIDADVSKTKDVSGWKKALYIKQLLCSEPMHGVCNL